jgi:hypothetical protein
MNNHRYQLQKNKCEQENKEVNNVGIDTKMFPAVNMNRKFLNADEMALLNEIQSRTSQTDAVCIVYLFLKLDN